MSENYICDKDLTNFDISNKNNSNQSNSINSSQSSLKDNPIVNEMIEFGINPLYAQRIYFYIQPNNIEEALEFLVTDNEIIQHHFFQDRRKATNLCYLCGEIKEYHFDYAPDNIEKKMNKKRNNKKKSNNEDISKNKSIKYETKNLYNSIRSDNNNNFSDKNIKDNIDYNSKINSVNNSNSNNKINNSNNDDNIKTINQINNDIKYNKRNNNNEVNNNKRKNNDFNNKYISMSVNINGSFNDTEKNDLEQNDNYIGNEKKPKLNLSQSQNFQHETKESINIDKDDYNLSKNNICAICNETFTSTDENTVKNCGHSFCNECWYDTLKVKIEENKLSTIKCLINECQEKLSDEFIFKLLNNEDNLIKKYKKYKFELEIMNNPNKKLCPFPNCDSYLELKDINIKDVKCLNNHFYCFLCLQEPHGKSPCNQKLDSSMKEFAKNHFVKKCPNCEIITEKNKGCNHMSCPKCNYQWCWLCNGKYNENHYLEGKCAGLQFFRPDDDNHIKLMFEGRINLSASQIQEYDDDDEIDDIEQIEQQFARIEIINREIHNHIINDINSENSGQRYNNRNVNREIYNVDFFNCDNRFKILCLYLLFGHMYIPYKKTIQVNKLNIVMIFMIFFIFEIPYFFFIIFINLLLLPFYLLNSGFYYFIQDFYILNERRFSRNITIIWEKIYYLILFIFFSGFVWASKYAKKINYINEYRNRLVFEITNTINFGFAYIYIFIFYPFQLIFGFFYTTFIFLKYSNYLEKFEQLLHF